jgi:hypothetical protein
MSDPKPRKTATRKTTRPRSTSQAQVEAGDGPARIEGVNAAGIRDEGSTTASMRQSNEPRNSEEPVLAIQQVADADISAADRTDNSHSSDAVDGSEDLDGEIRRRAYELYLARGAAEGDDLSDWLEAERLVRSPGDGSEERVQELPPTE